MRLELLEGIHSARDQTSEKQPIRKLGHSSEI